MTSVELSELIGQLIDIFEDFLTEKGIASPHKVFIKDEDYNTIGEKLIDTLVNWQLITVANSAPEIRIKLGERSKCMAQHYQNGMCTISGCLCSDVPDEVCASLQKLIKHD